MEVQVGNDQPEIMIDVQSVNKSFVLPNEQSSGLKQVLVTALKRDRGTQKQDVLQDISFQIRKGEFFGIVGRNGSGKSTLLKLISGIYTPDSGNIGINGSLTPFIELGVGFNHELTGRENVYMNGALLGFSHKEVDAMYDDIVMFAELERFMDQKLKNYSSGMQVRLAFSIAIRANTQILVLDEVLAVGDAAFQQKCFDYFAELKAGDKTVVLVTHDMDSVKRFCDRAMIISKGKIEAIGKPADISDIYLMENIPSRTEKNQEKQKTVSASMEQGREYTIGEAVDIRFDYDSPDTDHYMGISLFKNGQSVGEYNSKDFSFPVTNSTVELKLDTINLNPGLYGIGVAIFTRQKGALLAFNNNAETFYISGDDGTRGGAMKLTGTFTPLITHE